MIEIMNLIDSSQFYNFCEILRSYVAHLLFRSRYLHFLSFHSTFDIVPVLNVILRSATSNTTIDQKISMTACKLFFSLPPVLLSSFPLFTRKAQNCTIYMLLSFTGYSTEKLPALICLFTLFMCMRLYTSFYSYNYTFTSFPIRCEEMKSA